MNRVLLALASFMLIFSSCKQDEINIQQKNSSWKLKDVIHYTDNVRTENNSIVAIEQKDGKISQFTASFSGGLPVYGGKFQIVDTLSNPRQVRFSVFVGSNPDSTYRSYDQIADSAIITIIDNKINIEADSFFVSKPYDPATYRMSVNLRQRY